MTKTYVNYDQDTGSIRQVLQGAMLHLDSLPTPYIEITGLPQGSLHDDYLVQGGVLVAKST